jgi:hypothetical protein
MSFAESIRMGPDSIDVNSNDAYAVNST